MRFPPILFPLACVLSAPVLGGPVELAIVAAMKLPEAPNYSWRTDVSDDAKSYEISGATDRAEDFSLVTMPMRVPGWRRGPGGPVPSDTVVTAWFKGGQRCLIQVEEGWQRPDEVFGGGEMRGRRGGPPIGPGARGRSGRGRGGPPGEARPGAYSNLQNTLARPHEEIAIIVAGASELKVEGDVVGGVLSDTAAKLLLVHEGQKQITPLRASGTFRLWVRAGALVKYETKLEGVLAVESSAGRREVTVNQTALTTLAEVGATRLEVPAEVRKKLGS